MAEVGVRVADALDDGEVAGIPEALELGELLVQAGGRVERQRVGGRDRDVGRAGLVVRAVVDRHHHVQPVVAAEHAEDRRGCRRSRRSAPAPWAHGSLPVSTDSSSDEPDPATTPAPTPIPISCRNRRRSTAHSSVSGCVTGGGVRRRWRCRDRAWSGPHATCMSGASRSRRRASWRSQTVALVANATSSS